MGLLFKSNFCKLEHWRRLSVSRMFWILFRDRLRVCNWDKWDMCGGMEVIQLKLRSNFCRFESVFRCWICAILLPDKSSSIKECNLCNPFILVRDWLQIVSFVSEGQRSKCSNTEILCSSECLKDRSNSVICESCFISSILDCLAISVGVMYYKI